MSLFMVRFSQSLSCLICGWQENNGLIRPRAVLDLPQMYAKPLATDILKALELLATKPRSFGPNPQEVRTGRTVQPAGISQYLTSIISSSLSWLDSDELREAVWDAAAARLSERSGRAGRRFAVCQMRLVY